MTQEELHQYELAGTCYDEEGTLIGRYIYLWHPSQQEILDEFCRSWLSTYEKDKSFYLTRDLETQGLDPYTCKVILNAVSWDNDNALVFLPENFDCSLYKEVLEKIPINNHNNKFDTKFDKIYYGVQPYMNFCTMNASRLAWSGIIDKFDLAFLVKRFLEDLKVSKDIRMDFVGMIPVVDSQGVTTWKGRNDKVPDLNSNHARYAAQDAMLTHRLVVPIASRLEEQNLWDLWEKVECPLLNYFVDVELKGLNTDWNLVQELFDSTQEEILDLSKRIDSLILEKLPDLHATFKGKKKDDPNWFNPNSRDKLILVAKNLGLLLKDTKKETLEEHRNKLLDIDRNDRQETLFKFLNDIITFKDQSSYFTKYVKPWGTKYKNVVTKRTHPNIHIITSRAQTGRMSATEPNVMAVKPDFRPAVKADEGWSLIIRDYSQYEFRAAAGFSNEKVMLDSFRRRAELLPIVTELSNSYGESDPDTFVKDIDKERLGKDEVDLINEFMDTDIHRRNASEMFGVASYNLTGTMRKTAKTLGYTVLYGGTEARVQEALAKDEMYYSLNDCSKFISKFFSSLPNLKDFLDSLKAAVLDPGYICTPLGRKKFFSLPPKWKWNYQEVLMDSERQAANAMQQSSNADATKLAMVDLAIAFEDYELDQRPRILFPVHDELITTAPKEIEVEVFDLVGEIMVKAGETAINDTCPVEVSGKIVPYWIK